MTTCTDVGFAEDVIPKGSLALPARGSDANLLRSERSNSDVTGHSLARRESDTVTALQVTNGERMIVLNLALTGDGYRQLDECSHQLPIDSL